MPSELTVAISRVLDAAGHGLTGGFHTAVPGLGLLRSSDHTMPRHMTYRPSLCVVAQGAKQVMVGDRTITYHDMQALIVTVEVPVLSQIVDASPDRPYVGLTLGLDPDILLDVLSQLGPSRQVSGTPGFGMVVKDMDRQLADPVTRLVELAGRPEAVSILYPAIMREISYWLLTGPAGGDVARMILPSGQPLRIAKAIHHLRDNFDCPVNIPELARIANMSVSSFHQHFKIMTSMSPLQYQKHIRLLEARRRMVSDGEKAGSAAFSVGYESVSQFSREYARMFGAPPRRETQLALANRAASEAA